jgi:hypothetical protein
VGKRTDILYRLARFLAGIPPEALGAMVLCALTHRGLIAAFVAMVLGLIPVFVAVVLFCLQYIAGVIIDAIVTWYMVKMLAIHLWPRLPHKLKRLLRRLEDRALLKPPEQERATECEPESAFSRHSKRHPHW